VKAAGKKSQALRLYNKNMQATSRSHKNHENKHVRSIGQGKAKQGKHNRLKLRGGQAYVYTID
jgi:hypothetical protein